jgi:hypothetical protein
MRFLAKYWYHDENAAARWLIAYFAGSVFSYPFWWTDLLSALDVLERRAVFSGLELT